MPTPNYGYEKRQKELAKKRKKEEKAKAKAERREGQKSGPAPDGASGTPGSDTSPTDAGGASPV